MEDGMRTEKAMSEDGVFADHASTTPPTARVLFEMERVLRLGVGNPSSIHTRGRMARRIVDEAREKVAALLDCEVSEIVFTSGGTEADNLALTAAVKRITEKNTSSLYNKKEGNGTRGDFPTIVISGIEHPAVTETALDLGRRGAKIVTVDADERDSAGEATGRVNISSLTAALEEHGASLAALMAVNNETGVIQNVREAAEAAHRCGALFHCDAVQAVGQIPFSVRETMCDFAAVSGHKIHAPFGVGALYVRGGEISPMMYGGGQENGRRSGTESVAAIAAFGEACAEALDNLRTGENFRRVSALRDDIERELLTIRGAHRNGTGERTPGILNISFDGVSAEALVLHCDIGGVYISAGSACHSGVEKPSQTLLSMGLDEARARGAIRVSIGAETTEDDARRIVRVITDSVALLRKMA